MRNFYTNVQTHRGKILFRGVMRGQRVNLRLSYSPTLYLEGDGGDHTSVEGVPLVAKKFGSIKEAKDYAYKFREVSNVRIYGRDKHHYSYVDDFFKDCGFDRENIRVAVIDLECASTMSFPFPEEAREVIQAITMYVDGVYHVWGLKDYKETRPDVRYTLCESEEDLLRAFMRHWSSDYPDAVTGWNTRYFDIPYIYNRLMRVLGEPWAKLLSPWGLVDAAQDFDVKTGKTRAAFDIVGIADLDYLRVFKKFALDANQEEYTLNHIASVILKENKLDYADYGTLRDLYEQNHQLFIDYNVRDVELVVKMEEKRRLIDLILHLAYDAGCNYEDTFHQTKIWSVICYNYLKDNSKMIMSLKWERKEKSGAYVGAYVHLPTPGKYKWVVSMDFKSLYPTIMMSFNISPDTLVRVDDCNFDALMNETQEVRDDPVFCANGARFRRDKKGLFTALMEKYIKRRDSAKDLMQEAQRAYEKTKDKKYEIEASIQKMKQNAYKVSINSLYGASGAASFYFYDTYVAEAITKTGQYLNKSIFSGIDAYLNRVLKTKDQKFVIYGDTDSTYINLERVVQKFCPNKSVQDTTDFLDRFVNEVLQKEIDKILARKLEYLRAYQHEIVLKREAICDNAVFTEKKKRYALNVIDNEGTRYSEPEVKITGFEAIKSSNPAACREQMKKDIRIVLNGTEQELQENYKRFEREYPQQEIDKISPSSSVTDVDKYTLESKHLPRHVRAAIVYNNVLDKNGLSSSYERANNGSKIKYVELKEPNPFGSGVIGFIGRPPKEIDISRWIDYDKMFQKNYVKPLRAITDVARWSLVKKNKLNKFT